MNKSDFSIEDYKEINVRCRFCPNEPKVVDGRAKCISNYAILNNRCSPVARDALLNYCENLKGERR